MAKFLIQAIDGQVRHDFSFALMEAIDYQNWLQKGSHEYELIDFEDMFECDYTGFVPSGTVQFVKKYLASYHDVHSIKPINIPQDLRRDEYLKRIVMWKTRDEIIELHGKDGTTGLGFFKSNDKIKGIAEIMDTKDADKLTDGNYIVSKIVNIESEWRAFVYGGVLVGLQNYLGDFTMMPDVRLIREMIVGYNNSPPAYTIDVGVNEDNGTFLIEVHNFFSTGTYGFNDNKILPQMAIRSFKHLVVNGY